MRPNSQGFPNGSFPPIAVARCNIHAQKMTRRRLLTVLALAVVVVVVTLPMWGMGLAVFLDAERTVLSRSPSPDGKRIAQVERLVVGGVPSIVVIVRSWWMPNWYLAGCVAARHYQETDARSVWKSNGSLAVMTSGNVQAWTNSAPFKDNDCAQLTTSIVPN